MQLRKPSLRTVLVTAIIAPLVIAAFVIAGLPRHSIDIGLETIAIDVGRGWPLWHARETTADSPCAGADDEGLAFEVDFAPEDELLTFTHPTFPGPQRATQSRPWASAANVLVALMAIVALTAVVLRWRARRRGWLRPHLVDLFAISTMAALVCAHAVQAIKREDHLKQIVAQYQFLRLESAGLVGLGDTLRGFSTAKSPGRWGPEAEAEKYSWLARLGLVRQSVVALFIGSDEQGLKLLDDPLVAADLERVVIVDRPITADLLDQLARLPRLQSLYLRVDQYKLTDGPWKLSAAPSRHHWPLADAAWLHRFPALRHLAIEVIVEEVVFDPRRREAKLVRSIPGEGKPAGPTINLQGLAQLNDLEQLRLSVGSFTGDLASELRQLSRLQRVRLDLVVDGPTIEALGECSALRAIDLRRIVESADYAGLAKLTRLEHLRLPRATDDDLRRLTAQHNLKSLHVVGGEVTDAGLAHLREQADLTTLNLRGCKLSNASAPILQSLRRLKHLDLTSTQITGDTVAALAELPELERLTLDGTAVTDSDLEKVAQYPKLILLSVAGCSVSDAACMALQRARPKLAVTGLGVAVAARPGSADDQPAASDETPPAPAALPGGLPSALP